jgi:hypothetical protein
VIGRDTINHDPIDIAKARWSAILADLPEARRSPGGLFVVMQCRSVAVSRQALIL